MPLRCIFGWDVWNGRGHEWHPRITCSGVTVFARASAWRCHGRKLWAKGRKLTRSNGKCALFQIWVGRLKNGNDLSWLKRRQPLQSGRAGQLLSNLTRWWLNLNFERFKQSGHISIPRLMSPIFCDIKQRTERWQHNQTQIRGWKLLGTYCPFPVPSCQER